MEEINTAEEALAAVKQNGWALQHVPESLKSAEVCLAALESDGNATAIMTIDRMTPRSGDANQIVSRDSGEYNRMAPRSGDASP